MSFGGKKALHKKNDLIINFSRIFTLVSFTNQIYCERVCVCVLSRECQMTTIINN